ncbi:polysaccharide deacetylase [uncultured Microbacterium sp.]|uniref:polysaccharide deacetylase family protein n=1 Tax=uncultured Microbacterium sp. TaxID=191216 RepID=UPI0028D096E5|nr:polysaccharide deacetylase [uncultured Microbacterium sp.]
MSRTAAETPVWPGGASCAASFTFDVDAESAALSAAPTSAQRMSVMSHQNYGPLVGVPRLLRMLDRAGLRSTFFVPGFTALRHERVVRDIVAAGHEIAHHGFLHEPWGQLTLEEEVDALDRGIEVLERIAGSRPVGFRAPLWDLNWRTPELLRARGFLYDSSLMDADVPYRLSTEGGSIVEVPIQWGLDDWEQYCFIPGVYETGVIVSPDQAVATWRAEYQATRTDNGCFVLTNHPFLSGRPGRAAALEALVTEIAADPLTWVAPLEEIARFIESTGSEPRSIDRPANPTR